MFFRKGILIFSLCAALLPRAFGMPDCGVCASPTWRSSSVHTITTLGEKKILYIRVNYPDDSIEPISAASASDLMSEVSSFYRTHSYGRCWTTATITPVITMPLPKSSYFTVGENGRILWNSYTVLNDAREAARHAGFDFAQYDFDIVRFNAPFLQSWANIGARGAWLVSSHPATTIHEIGHNFGLYHANAWRGANVEYGDIYDIMGNPGYYQLAGFNTIRKMSLGWLEGSHQQRITASGVYRLSAHDTNEPVAGRTYVLRVAKDGERDYWIEKRQSFDYSDDMEFSGVLLYWDEWSQSNSGTHLLDPAASPGWALPVLTSFTDVNAAVRIIPIRQSDDRSYIDIAIIFGNAPLNILPGLLHFAGTPTHTYTVLTSSDLRTWNSLTQASSTSGVFLVPIETETSHRFYRVIPNGN